MTIPDDIIYTFRFDDISINTDSDKLMKMIGLIRRTLRSASVDILISVSPAVQRMDACADPFERERPFPSMFHVESDFRVFYRPDLIAIPPIVTKICQNPDISIAGHGMIHVDHRLMKRSAQELSIVMSCALLQCRTFVPPFHKWNAKTESVCDEHGIELVKYDSSWRHLFYHKFDAEHQRYYLHTHDFTYEDFCARFS